MKGRIAIASALSGLSGLSGIAGAAAPATPWYLSGGVDASACAAAWLAKGAASLAASYDNLAAPANGAADGTGDLAGATPTWDASIGWTCSVSFTAVSLLTTNAFTVYWRGKLHRGTSDNTCFNNTTGWNGGLVVGTWNDPNLYVGCNGDGGTAYRFGIAAGTEGTLLTITYQKLADQSQRLWLDGVEQSGSPKAGYAWTGQSLILGTQGDGQCVAACVHAQADSDAVVAAMVAAMGAL